MRRFAFVALFLPIAAAALPAAAGESVIRGGAINFSRADRGAPAYSGSSAPTVAGTTILRGTRPSAQHGPAANFGSDTDGPILDPACLYTEPPTCR